MCLAYYDIGQSGLICLLRVFHIVMRKPLYVSHYANFRLVPLLDETASAAGSPPIREILPVLSQNGEVGKVKTDHPRQRSGTWVGAFATGTVSASALPQLPDLGF